MPLPRPGQHFTCLPLLASFSFSSLFLCAASGETRCLSFSAAAVCPQLSLSPLAQPRPFASSRALLRLPLLLDAPLVLSPLLASLLPRRARAQAAPPSPPKPPRQQRALLVPVPRRGTLRRTPALLSSQARGGAAPRPLGSLPAPSPSLLCPFAHSTRLGGAAAAADDAVDAALLRRAAHLPFHRTHRQPSGEREIVLFCVSGAIHSSAADHTQQHPG